MVNSEHFLGSLHLFVPKGTDVCGKDMGVSGLPILVGRLLSWELPVDGVGVAGSLTVLELCGLWACLLPQAEQGVKSVACLGEFQVHSP